MSKKTKKSRVTTAALGSLAGIATVASVASVIACGHGGQTKESTPSTQQIDTQHINLSGVKVFDNGEVQGLPSLPKGVHFDYFLDGQTKVVHDVHELELYAGAKLHLQLGADAGYALNGDLHKTSVLIDHYVVGVITDNSYEAFTSADVHILPNGHIIGLPPVPLDAHWHYAALVTDKEIVLRNKDGRFPSDTTLTVGDFVAIAVVADQNYEFSGATPGVRGFIVEAASKSVRTIVQVEAVATAPRTILSGEWPVYPRTPLHTEWFLDDGRPVFNFDPANYKPGDVVTFTLKGSSEEYEVSENVKITYTIVEK